MDQETIDFFQKCDEYGMVSSELATCGIISLKNFYYYKHVPNTASTAIAHYLYNYEFDKTLAYKYFHSNPHSNGGVEIYKTATGATALLPYHISAKFFREILQGHTPIFNFSSIRNPYTRFYKSVFLLSNPKTVEDVFNFTNKKLEEKEPHFTPITKIVNYNNIFYDFLIRFENFSKDMELLFPSFPNDPAAYPSSKATIDEFYSNSELVKFVQDTYKEDFDNFGYSLDFKEVDEYDNSVIPRNYEDFGKKPSAKQYSIDVLNGQSLTDLGYCPDIKFSGTTLDFFLFTRLSHDLINFLVTNGYYLFSFENIEKAISEFINKLKQK